MKLVKYADTIEKTERIRELNEAVGCVAGAPLADNNCGWATLPLVALHEGLPRDAWETLDPIILNAVSTSFPTHRLDDLVRVGPKGLIRAVCFFASAKADHDVPVNLYQDKIAVVVDAIRRRYL